MPTNRNITTQQQIRDLENQLEDAVAKRDGKAAKRLEQQIEFLKSTLEATMLNRVQEQSSILEQALLKFISTHAGKGTESIIHAIAAATQSADIDVRSALSALEKSKRISRGPYGWRTNERQLNSTGKLSRTSLLESRTQQEAFPSPGEDSTLQAELGDYCDFGPYGKAYVVGERSGFYLVQDEPPTGADFSDPNLGGAIHKSSLEQIIRSADDEPDEEDDFEESIREQDWTRPQTDEERMDYADDPGQYIDMHQADAGIEEAIRFFLTRNPGASLEYIVSYVSGKEGDISEAAIRGVLQRIATETGYGWRFNESVREQDEPSADTDHRWDGLEQPEEISSAKPVARLYLLQSSPNDTLLRLRIQTRDGSVPYERFLRAEVDNLSTALTAAHKFALIIGLELDEDPAMVTQWSAATKRARQQLGLQSDVQLAAVKQEEARRREQFDQFYSWGRINAALTKATVVPSMIVRVRSALGSKSEFSWEGINAALMRLQWQPANIARFLAILKQGNLEESRRREGVAWPLTIPAGWQNISGLLPTIQKIISTNGTRKYVKIIFDTKDGVLRIQGTPKPTNQTYVPTEAGLRLARLETEKLVTQESRDPKAVKNATSEVALLRRIMQQH